MIHAVHMRAAIVEDYYLQTTEKGFERECGLLATVVAYDAKARTMEADRALEASETAQLFHLLDDEVKWLLQSRCKQDKMH